MDLPSYNTPDDLPWPLIVSALQGELSPEEDVRFRGWLAASDMNQEKYERLSHIWREEMKDYGLYTQADESDAWQDLQERLSRNSLAPVIDGGFKARKPVSTRWTIAAALILLAGVAVLWKSFSKSAVLKYETVSGEQKRISLPDGSTVTLGPQTSLRVKNGYNSKGRTVILGSGEATFEVLHQEQQVFSVEMDEATVRDIGTSFTIRKTKDSINVVVSSGKVGFTQKATGETRELSAGSSLSFYTMPGHNGEIRTSVSLRFDDAPLSSILQTLEKHYGKHIILTDTTAAHKKLTLHLDGESLADALKIICASIDLDYTSDKSGYILKKREQ